MRALNTTILVILVIGGLNWGLIGMAGFDLVAFITGVSFGGLNIVNRLIYLLVGVAALYQAGYMMTLMAHHHHGPRHATA